MKRLRFLMSTAPRVAPKFKRDPNALVSFAPMDALVDGLGGLQDLETKSFSEVAGGSYNYFEDGDILLAKVTPCFENGKKAIARDLENGAGFATSEVFVFRPKEDGIDTCYLRYLFCSEDFRHKAIASMTGAGGLRRVSERAVLDFPLRITDLPTQRAIADFLDRETARIDSLIEKKQRLVELLGERLTLSIRNLVTRGTYENTDNAPSGLYWCPFLPQNWQVRKGFHIGTLIGSIGGEETDDAEETLPYIKVSDLNACDGGRLTTTKSMFRPQSRPVSQFRDFLVFPKRGAAIFTNKVAIAPKGSAIDPNVMGWVIFKHHEPEYFLWVLKIRTLDNLADISTVPQINNKHIYPERFPVPPRDEQIEIVREIKRVLSRADKTSDLTQTSIDRLKEYRSALITCAVTGQIDVSTYSRSGTTDRQLDAIQGEM